MPDRISKQGTPLRLFALSYYYPPANNPRAVQVCRLLKHLSASTVLVCGHDYATDDRMDANQRSAQEFLEDCLRVRFTQPPWKRWTARIAYQFGIYLWEKTPDRYVDWKPTVTASVADYARRQDYQPDLMVTFGSPMSDHLIGIELKRQFKTPWIAHFSDPWIENQFKNYSSLTRCINVGLEGRVIKAADRVVFTSEETLQLVMAKYPESFKQKGRVLPHAFEPELYKVATPSSESTIVIRYLGDLYLQRSPAPLFNGIKSLLASAPDLLDDVKFEFYGSITSLDLNGTGYSQLPQGLVTFHKTVDYLKSLSLMSEADGLLVIDAPADWSVFLPSKLIDYVGADRPIMGITPEGAAASLIREGGGWIADPSNASAIEDTLKSFLRSLRQNKTSPVVHSIKSVVRQRYDADAVAAKFESIVAELLDTEAHRRNLLLSPENHEWI